MLEELKELNQWVCWSKSKERGKIPINPREGNGAQSNNPDTWGSYDEVMQYWRKHPNKISGIGFVFTKDDPYFGVDIDKCIDENGEFDEKSRDITDRLGHTYVEYSPSGNGLHIIGRGRLPSWCKNAKCQVEAYERGRYFTMTFNHVPACSEEIVDAGDALYAMCEIYLRDDEEQSNGDASDQMGGQMPVLQHGNRDNGLTSLARSLYRRGVSKWEAYSVVEAVARNCIPPFDRPREKVDSVWKSEATHPREVIEWMNRNYGVVKTGGDVLIASMPEEKGEPVHFLKKSALVDFLANQKVRIEDGNGNRRTEEWVKYWMRHPERKTFRKLCFRPEQDVPEGYLNLWVGFGIDPAESSEKCEGFLKHLWKNIAQENEEYYEYLMEWFTSVIRYPNTGPQTVPVFRGEQGTGKGIIGHYLQRIFGNHYMTASQPTHFAGRFNEHLWDKVIVFADEAVWGGDKQAESELKHLITEPTRTVEPKGRTAFDVENKVHMIIASNADWIVPVGETDRRFGIFDIAKQRDKDEAALNQIWDELDTGGPEALLFHLKYERPEPKDIRVSKIPQTKAKQEQKIRGLGTIERIWIDWILSGAQGHRGTWKRIMQKNTLYDDFVDAAKQQKARYIPSMKEFLIKSKELFGDLLVEQRSRNVEQIAERYDIPEGSWHGDTGNGDRDGQKRWIVLGEIEHFEAAIYESLGIDLGEEK